MDNCVESINRAICIKCLECRRVTCLNSWNDCESCHSISIDIYWVIYWDSGPFKCWINFLSSHWTVKYRWNALFGSSLCSSNIFWQFPNTCTAPPKDQSRKLMFHLNRSIRNCFIGEPNWANKFLQWHFNELIRNATIISKCRIKRLMNLYDFTTAINNSSDETMIYISLLTLSFNRRPSNFRIASRSTHVWLTSHWVDTNEETPQIKNRRKREKRIIAGKRAERNQQVCESQSGLKINGHTASISSVTIRWQSALVTHTIAFALWATTK